MKVRGKTAWIVGASGGIGEHVAYEMSKRGARRIYISSRNVEALKKVARQCSSFGAEATVMPLDVTDSLAIANSCDDILQSGGIDILVNNAGVSQRGLASETSLSVVRKIMEIDFFGLVDITQRILPDMIAKKSGHIAITSSVVGKFGFPLRSTYAASKHALHGYFESLYLENYSHNINVTLVCPGRIKTDISKNAIKADGSSHGEMDPGQANGKSVEACARIYVDGIESNKREVYIGREAMLIYFRRFAPAIFYRLAKSVNAR